MSLILAKISIKPNAKNKERMENEIKNIIREFANAREETLDNAVKRICALFDVVGQSEQLVCDKKCEWTRYPKDGIWYDGCVKCGKEVAN